MSGKLFFDIHCHAMDLSHPNLLAFIKRLPWRLLGLAIPILSPIISLFGSKKLERALNLLSVMENDIGSFFLVVEFYLKKNGAIQDDVLTIDDIDYDAIVLTPLLMDFGYKNIKNETYYRIPPQKPIIKQTIDVFNGINKYCTCELVESTMGKYEIQKREGKSIFEIYPFLGINTRNYDSENIGEMLDKYFDEYTGSYEALKANLGKFHGDIESLGSNFFAGIKVYPPVGFDPWPEADNVEIEKVKLLYQYCCDKNIPVTTHCSEMGFDLVKKKIARTYTSPDRWQKVLEQYPTLKINFAHFGYQTNFLFIFPNHKWQNEIARLMEQYIKVYTDFSCLAFEDVYYKSLKEVIGSNEKLLERTLLGTDFMINLLWIDSYNEYLDKFRTTQYLTPGEREFFCSTNPKRFLFA